MASENLDRTAFLPERVSVPVADEVLQRIVSRCCAALSADAVAITLLDRDEQHFAAEHGMPDDLAKMCGTPIAWSFCSNVALTGTTFVVEDTSDDGRFAENPLVACGLVSAYAGVPVRDATGAVVGALCAICAHPRHFVPADLGVLELAAEAATQRLQHAVAPPPLARLPSGTGLVVDGRWTLLALLGAGGQAEVWSAREKTTGRRVAVKLSSGSLEDEGRALAGVHHPNLVGVHASGNLQDGRSWLVMDAIDGEPLADVVATAGANADRFALDRVIEVAGALTSLHAAGLLHGDVKASNVLFDHDADRAVVIDLGLGLRIGGLGTGSRGTPGLSAPEQFNHTPLTIAVDSYGVAVLAYQLLTRMGPFRIGTPDRKARLQRQRDGNATPLSLLRPDLARLDALFDRALSPNPAHRPPTPLHFSAELAALLVGSGAPDPNASLADVWRAVRDTAIRLDGGDRVTATLPEPARQQLAIDDDDAWVDTGALTAWLHAWSGGRVERIDQLAAVVGKETARRLVRGNAVTFSAAAMMQAMSATFCRLHPWTHATPAGPGRVSMELPFDPAVWMPWMAAITRAVFARAGRQVETKWEPDGDRWTLAVTER